MPSDQETVDGLVAELRSCGLRATTARRAVLEELVAAGDTHLGAEELARRVGEGHPAIHLSTIYRTLDALTEVGLISLARFADQSATYHLTTDVHHHAVCTRCGATLQLAPRVLDPVRRSLLRDHGFRADPRHLTITGVCEACSQRR